MPRSGLAQWIGRQKGLACCGQVDHREAAEREIRLRRPELLLTELRVGEADGIDTVKQIHAHYPRLAILVFSHQSETIFAERALRAGARGYVMKQAPEKELLGAIRSVLAGEVYLSRKFASALLNRVLVHPSAGTDPDLERLTDRELQIFQQIGAGLPPRQIAETLHLSAKTVQAHRENIRRKLRLGDSRQLSRHASLWVAACGGTAG